MKNSIIIIIIAIIVAGIVFFTLGFTAGKNSIKGEIDKYKKVIDYYFPVREEMFSVSGKITDIQGKIISIETIVEDPYVLPDEREIKTVKVNVDDNTRIAKFDIETRKEIKLGISDLKTGDEISAGADENIKGRDEFTASSINLFVVPEMPEMPESTE